MAIAGNTGALGFGGQFTRIVVGVCVSIVGVQSVAVIVNTYECAINVGTVTIKVKLKKLKGTLPFNLITVYNQKGQSN